jgi:Flp pilus assembly protein TadG
MVRTIRKFYKRLRALCFDDGGAIAVITALMLPVLVGFIALGIDTADWYANHRQMERIVEVTAAAAAPYLSSNTAAQVTAIAENVAALNGLSTSKGDKITVSVGSNPSSLTVTANRKLNLFFSALFLRTPPITTASATAGGSSGNPVCMLSHTLVVDSGASLNAPNCEIDVASTGSGAAVFNGSLPNVGKVCVAGTSTLGSGVTVHNLTNNCATAPNTNSPPAPTIPGACIVNGAVYGPGTVTLNPGRYCGNFNWNGPGTLKLNPGLYILDGGVNWTLSEQWTINGTGVTFYLVNSSSYLDFNGSATIKLTPPTSGPYANILMFEPPGLSGGTSGCTGDGCFNLTAQTSGNALQGLVYLPSRNIFLQATSINASGLTLVANTVTFYSTMSLSMSPGRNALTSASGTGLLTN